ncbi:MAG: hypothetical protein A2Y71_05350 [Bacteroidetes bacterium RBG_13_42_15]|nr:MAG: hypothetical protein A2Y71_05350 [Bacteroidetes bacterium RBG_13_42_15]
MGNGTITFKNSTLSKILFTLSILIFVFWFVNHKIEINNYPLAGAMFDLLWLFILIKLCIIPVLSLVHLIREKFNFRSLHLYTIIIAVTNICFVIFIIK